MLSDRFLFQQVSGKIAIFSEDFLCPLSASFLETLDVCRNFAVFTCVGWNPMFLDIFKFFASVWSNFMFSKSLLF